MDRAGVILIGRAKRVSQNSLKATRPRSGSFRAVPSNSGESRQEWRGWRSEQRGWSKRSNQEAKVYKVATKGIEQDAKSVREVDVPGLQRATRSLRPDSIPSVALHNAQTL